jgi:hypothetical protein
MGVAIYPNTASVIKSLQTGTAVSAGTITISAVNTAKTVVHSISTGSSGTVAATGTLSAANGSTSGMSFSASAGYASGYQSGAGNASTGIVGVASSTSPRYGTTTSPVSGNLAAGAMYMNIAAMNTNGMNVGLNTTSLSGGTTSLTAALYGATLTNSTTLTVTGPCSYQVIEYY